jgi:hypothetical protein
LGGKYFGALIKNHPDTVTIKEDNRTITFTLRSLLGTPLTLMVAEELNKIGKYQRPINNPTIKKPTPIILLTMKLKIFQ